MVNNTVKEYIWHQQELKREVDGLMGKGSAGFDFINNDS
jgi:hypothetical protein